MPHFKRVGIGHVVAEINGLHPDFEERQRVIPGRFCQVAGLVYSPCFISRWRIKGHLPVTAKASARIPRRCFDIHPIHHPGFFLQSPGFGQVIGIGPLRFVMVVNSAIIGNGCLVNFPQLRVNQTECAIDSSRRLSFMVAISPPGQRWCLIAKRINYLVRTVGRVNEIELL